ncbi:MAG: MFS transporter [Anaerolineae bacterium]
MSRGSALVVACIASFLAPFMASSVVVALPRMEAQFQVPAVTLTWVTISYLLAASIAMVPIGRLGDIYGRKRILLTGLAVYALSTLLSALSPSAEVLIACRVLEGIGGAMIAGTAVAILISVYPPAERGRVLGISTATVYAGLSLGPVLGGILTQHWGWQSIFLVTLPAALLGVVLVLWRLPGEWAEARCEGFDLPGSLGWSLALLLVMLGFSRVHTLLGAVLLAGGLAGLGGFVAWELRSTCPVLNIGLFRGNPVFALSNLAALLNYAATYGVGFLLTLYLQRIKGLDPQSAGLVLLAQPLLQATLSPLAGRLSDRLEPRLVASAGMGACAVGLVVLSTLVSATPLPVVVGCLLFLGLGFALFSSPNMNAIMGAVERRQYGVASGMVGTMRSLGQMFSMGLVMLVFTITLGQTQIVPGVYERFVGSMHLLFGMYAALCALGVVASLARGKVRRPAVQMGDSAG